MNMTLIVPISADRPEYEVKLPYVFTQDSDGTMLCVKSILGLPLEQFNNIFFVILRKHDEHYFIKEQLLLQFRRFNLTNAQIITLDEPTSSQAETIVRAIKSANIEGCIFIKDADGYFTADEILQQNGVTVYPLEELSLVDPQHKSYVAVDDMNYITNIIEQRIVSHFFNAGGYCFEDATDFCKYYNKLKDYGPLYLSHIIYAMMLDRYIFRPIDIKNYQDWELGRTITNGAVNKK